MSSYFSLMSAGTRPCIDRSRRSSGDVFRALTLSSLCCLAAHLFAPRLAKIRAFFRSYPMHIARTIHCQVMARNLADWVSYTFLGSSAIF